MSAFLAQVLVIVWCGWESHELIWLYSQKAVYDAYPGIFFILWLTPLLVYTLRPPLFKEGQIRLSIIAVFCALFGRIISFEFPGQIGLALSLAALLPATARSYLWLLGALSWIHPFKWFVLQVFPPEFVTPVRLTFLLIALLAIYGVLRREKAA